MRSRVLPKLGEPTFTHPNGQIMTNSEFGNIHFTPVHQYLTERSQVPCGFGLEDNRVQFELQA
jgi:hypothetical protein